MSKEEIGPEEPMQPPPMGGMLLTMLFMLYIIMNEDIRAVSYTHLTLPTKA